MELSPACSASVHWELFRAQPSLTQALLILQLHHVLEAGLGLSCALLARWQC